MQVSELTTKVKQIIDMDNMSALIETDDIDSTSLEAIIESKAVPASRLIMSLAPAHLLIPGSDISSSITWAQSNGMYVGKVVMPSDFLRLLVFKMDDWERPGRVITDESAEYAVQSSKWAGLRGNPEAPVVAIVKDGGTTGIGLEIYSCTKSTAKVEDGKYIPVPAVTSGALNVPSKVEDAVLYACASMVSETLGNASLASQFMARAYGLAEITTNKQDNNGNN